MKTPDLFDFDPPLARALEHCRRLFGSADDALIRKENPIPPRARNTDPATSHAAARNADKFAPTHAARILAALAAGPATVDELAARMDLQSQQINKRLPELERAGLAIPTDDLRRSRSGNMERVWKLSSEKY